MDLVKIIIILFKVILITALWGWINEHIDSWFVFEQEPVRWATYIGFAAIYVLVLNATVLSTLENDDGTGS